jgi:hypothetical protein
MNRANTYQAGASRIFTAGLLLFLFAVSPALATVGGVSANHAQGVVLLGDGGAACSSTITGALRYNSSTNSEQVCNGTLWGDIGGMTLISTQTASTSASLIFTNLPPYNTLFLNCNGLIATATNTILYAYVGESTGPTWETSANYNLDYEYSNLDGDTNVDSKTTGPSLLDAPGFLSTYPFSFKLYIDNITSSSTYKDATILLSDIATNGDPYQSIGTATWNSDTNPVTGLKIVAASGNIASGTCSLYGMM